MLSSVYKNTAIKIFITFCICMVCFFGIAVMDYQYGDLRPVGLLAVIIICTGYIMWLTTRPV